MTMPWLAGMNVGVARLDSEHRHLFEVMGELRTSVLDGNGSGVRALFDELHAATIEHFAAEERLMARWLYPERAAHVAEHDGARARLIVLGGLIQAGRLERVAEELGEYSLGYFRGILRHDRLFARFMQERVAPTMSVPSAG